MLLFLFLVVFDVVSVKFLFPNVLISRALNDPAVSSCILLHFTANIDPTRRYLYLQVLGGKAFLEHLQEPEPLPGQVCSTFTLCLHYRNQRFRSKPVPCACEPDFHDGFLLEVHRENLGKYQ